MTRFALLFVILLTASQLLSACNTVNGIGRDLRQAGDSLSSAAN